MIRLTDLLKEITNKPKAIIMAGGASVGKSTVLRSLQPILKDFIDLNADKYVEDKDSPMYGNLSAASSQIRKQDLPYVYTAYSSIDTMTTVVFCLYILFINKDAIFFMQIANFIGLAGCISLFLLAKESPRWLLLNDKKE